MKAEQSLIVRQLNRMPYEPVWQAMSQFTSHRQKETIDEIWLVEHDPVFTQGQAGRSEHLLNIGHIPLVQVDRGGQVTYHGPGQQVVYCLLDLKRLGYGVRELVSRLEQAIVALLVEFSIPARPRVDAPGVYLHKPGEPDDGAKICSLGLRIRKGCSFHGLALNVCMDLVPFERINPCGFQGLKVTQVKDQGGPDSVKQVEAPLIHQLMQHLGYNNKLYDNDLPVIKSS